MSTQQFYSRDPSTGVVRGPFTASQLKSFFSEVGRGDWGVSKSAKGPWQRASSVKGLVAAQSSPPVAASEAVVSATAEDTQKRMQLPLWAKIASGLAVLLLLGILVIAYRAYSEMIVNRRVDEIHREIDEIRRKSQEDSKKIKEFFRGR
jgi:hypothetical protein